MALKFLLNILFVSHQVTRTTIATPGAAAKIDLNLNQRNRLKDLIAKSAAQKEIAEGKFAVHLGEGSACQHHQRKGLHKGHAQGLAR